MGKVVINIKKGKATITEGEDTFIGKLIAGGGKLKLNTPRSKGEFEITKKEK